MVKIFDLVILSHRRLTCILLLGILTGSLGCLSWTWPGMDLEGRESARDHDFTGNIRQTHDRTCLNHDVFWGVPLVPLVPSLGHSHMLAGNASFSKVSGLFKTEIRRLKQHDKRFRPRCGFRSNIQQISVPIFCQF